MAVKRRKPQNHIERQIITGMIVSDEYLRKISSVYIPEYLVTEPIRIVADWCIEYFDEYKKAPSKHIKDIYQYHEERTLDEDQAEYIVEFLASINDEYERADKFNVEYLADQSIAYFEEQALRNIADDIKTALNAGDLEEAKRLQTSYNTVDHPVRAGIDPFDDVDAIQEAFEQDAEPLFRLPGALGEMVNEQLTRASLVMLQGPEKRGKTWWLMEFAMRAHRERCNVAFFSVGDMTQPQILRRQHIYISKRSDKAKYCGELRVPVADCRYNQDDSCDMVKRASPFGVLDSGVYMDFEEAEKMDYKPCTYCRKRSPKRYAGAYWYQRKQPVQPLGWRDAYKAGQVYKRRVRGKGFKLATFPNDSINVSGLVNVLDQWEVQEQFIPDVIVVDYADILAPEKSQKDMRHSINDTWKALKRLTQERHCCIITATQADADSYDKRSQKLKNFSEDKRKYSHINAGYALNQTPSEKVSSVMRIGELLVREDFSANREVVTLGRLEMGRPLLDSYWYVEPKKKGEDDDD